ncbi:hypothetical protein [Photobacterium sp. TY1-4]|uniref:hypothetical protein n=1 Tax=Photobacterium sp. TY1-4 TaxID=2899122 RepID=UPI0021C19A62|nr:hypothetical protein [Photobacterium sp. TY1-4]UXI04119.1 hypothetical protein NH461_18620 [Photobacterium sp. TY1-4]
MRKWIAAVLMLVVVSVMTTGLVSALADLAAFLLLLYAVACRAMTQSKGTTPSRDKVGADSVRQTGDDVGASQDKIDIAP